MTLSSKKLEVPAQVRCVAALTWVGQSPAGLGFPGGTRRDIRRRRGCSGNGVTRLPRHSRRERSLVMWLFIPYYVTMYRFLKLRRSPPACQAPGNSRIYARKAALFLAFWWEMLYSTARGGKKTGPPPPFCPLRKKSLRFDPPSAKSLFRFAGVAQLVEQWTENPRVGGSIPSPGTISKSHKVLQAPKSLAGLCFSSISQSQHVSSGTLSSPFFCW